MVGAGTIFVNGHLSNDKQEEISARVYWKDDYRVSE